MITMDVFKQDAFSAISLTTAIQDMPTVPGFLRSLNIFTPNPVRTTTVAVERQGATLKIIQTTERGSPRSRRTVDRRNVRNFNTVRLAESHRMMADSLQNIRGFGSETELMAAQAEIAKWQATLNMDLDTTLERHMLGAINGIVLDADDSVIYNYYDEFGISQPSEINFDWLNKTGVEEFVNTNVLRPMIRALGGRAGTSMRVMALCGDSFYDKSRRNAEYRATYLQTEQAAQLRETGVFKSYDAWGVTWVNYRGTDDGTTVAIGSDKCKFIPVGVPNVFQQAMSPAEGFDFVNTLGLPKYSAVVPDPTTRNEYADLDVAAYPLFICTSPEALLQGNE